jgi:two-component system sensor histidine kinase KdpD
MLVLTTTVLVQFRGSIEQSHAALTLLLVVLGGSAAGGRALGFTLACAGFAVIDYYFQPPFDLLSINKPLDVVILVAFFATAAVTTELLARARQEASAARDRANEVASLSVLGAETLRYARPTEALEAIADLVRVTLGATACAIVSLEDGGRASTVASCAVPPEAAIASEAIAAVEAHLRSIDRGPGAVDEPAIPFRMDSARDGDGAPIVIQVVSLPLRAEGRVIGMLVVRGDPALKLDAPSRRFLSALGYYAALGVERMRLVAAASTSEALREANRAKDQVLASVSHDLRTPLTTIKVLAQGAESRGEPSAAAIVEQADRLARMVGDLLELSRLRAGGLAPAVALNTAEDIIGAALRRAEGVVGDRTIVPQVDLESPALVGEFDFVQTLRIVGNLLDNALRYTPPGGSVELAAARAGDQLLFSVSDRGRGVDPAEQSRIFDAFYRPEGSSPDSGHAGLGLSIARTLAELQHGTLTHAARAGGGSVFTLSLPAADVGTNAAAEAE